MAKGKKVGMEKYTKFMEEFGDEKINEIKICRFCDTRHGD